MICNKCGREMTGTTAYDGACECGGLIADARGNLPGNKYCDECGIKTNHTTAQHREDMRDE